MTQILGIVGSPRLGGNTDILVQKILEGAQRSGAETSLVHLGGLTIQECNGCHGCWQTGQCVKKDDMIDLYHRIIQSDVMIFGTPVYWYGPTALMKGLIDRLVYFNSPQNRLKIKGKRAVLAVPFEETDLDTAALVVSFFEKSLEYLEIDLVTQLIVPGVTQKGEVLHHMKYIEKALDIGKKLNS